MITSMRLQRFKNFRDATLQLGPLTVVVGTNASGKSNLRDAFRFVHGMSRGYALAEIIGEKYVEGGVLQWKGIRGGTREVAMHGEESFALETSVLLPSREGGHELEGGEWTHRIEVSTGDTTMTPRVIRESLIGPQGALYDSHSESEPFEQEGPEFLVAGLKCDDDKYKQIRFQSSKPVISQLRDHQGIRLKDQMTAAYYLEMLLHMRFLDLSPDAMKLPSVPGQILLGDRGENLSSVLQALCKRESTKRAVAEWLQELTPLDVVDFEFVPDQTGRILVTLVESNGQRTSAYSASDGTLRFLAMIAALMGPDSAKFFFLEEIDNGIHPTRLSLLLQLIEQQTREGKLQVVTTTHSPQMLAMLSEEAREHASLVYRLEGSTEGHIRRIMDIPEARQVLQEQNLARLHESGWFENAVAFSEAADANL